MTVKVTPSTFILLAVDLMPSQSTSCSASVIMQTSLNVYLLS